MARIVLSYRRDDASAHAGRLFDRLVQVFGDDQVFMDIDSIDYGEDFVEVIQEAVGLADVLIVIIGRDWLGATNDAGERRIEDEQDFVRLELSTALGRDIRVIPVLVRNSTMPQPSELPLDLQALSTRNALSISDDRFHSDVDRLVESLQRFANRRDGVEAEALAAEARPAELADPSPQTAESSSDETDHPVGAPGKSRRKMYILGGLALVLFLLVIWWSLEPNRKVRPEGRPGEQSTPGRLPVRPPH